MNHPRNGRRQSGFALIEVLISIIILAVVATAVLQGFAAASGQVARSRTDTQAAQIAQGQMEALHRLTYDNVGLVNGNPTGTVSPTGTKTVDGTTYNITTTVVYVDDPAQGQAHTNVDYKKATITVTPAVSGAKAVTVSSIFAPDNYASISGKATAVVTVVDSLTGLPLQNAAVTLNGSTSPTRIDTTDANGKVVFAGLLPSATNVASPQYYYVASATLAGYNTDPATTPTQTRMNLAASQTWNVTIKMYKPATIFVNMNDSATGNAIATRADITVTPPAPGSPQLTSVSNGTATITTLGGQPIMPSASTTQVDVFADCYLPATQSSAVPATGYPTNTSQTFTFSLTKATSGWVDVYVKNTGGTALSGATVTLSGGPNNLNPPSRTTDASGNVKFCVPSGAIPYLIGASATGYAAGSQQATVTTNATTTVNIKLASTSGGVSTVRLTTASASQTVRLLLVSGGSGATYDKTGVTNASKYQDFLNVPYGNYQAFRATGFNSGVPTWGAPVSFTVSSANVTQAVP
ncbi:MAG: type II secretion system protein [Thermoleophilia bacterium]